MRRRPLAVAIAVTIVFTACTGGTTGSHRTSEAVATSPVAGATNAQGTSTPGSSPTGSSEAALDGTILFSLVFGIDGSHGSQLMTVHPDGTGLVALTNRDLGSASDPAWSADGRSVLFDIQDGPRGAQHIYSMPATGGTPTQLTSGKVVDRDPTASPDGEHILFARANPIDTPTSLYVMDPDGSHLRRITRGTGSDGDWKPSFSPDGTRIAFIRDGALAVANADGSHIREVVGRDAGVASPHWSPDGGSLVYDDTSADHAGTGIVRASGGAPRLIGAFLGDVSWSPDSTRIIGTFWQAGQPYVALVTMNLDGSDQTEIWHPHPDRNIFTDLPTWFAT